jgi:hypothetical protein
MEVARMFRKIPILAALAVLFCHSAIGQTQNPTPRLVTVAVDATQRVALAGNVCRLAQAGYDLGPMNESTPAERLLMVLNRPAQREAAFQQFLKDANTRGSGSWRRWLTPEQIGERFGPPDADVEAVTRWLGSEGFRVARVSKAKRFVEFSGTVGQVNAAFETRIDEYRVNGGQHHANATGLTIPKALAAIIGAVAPLDDFSRPAPQVVVNGKGEYNGMDRRFEPEFTGPTASSTPLYALAPADFATQYDLGPELNGGVTGTGVTVGIVNESNIDLNVAAAYRSVFGLTVNPVQVVIDGEDPGENSSATEAYLDVEMAGAAAPGAAVDLYISAGSGFQDPLLLAAARAVDDDQADILSVSYGGPEGGDPTWNDLWEQAAAQGQTVLVASGDLGQAQSFYFFQQVNGLASTPWDVAVGGTDFYYADYASGAPSAASDWNATNNPATKGSLKAPLTEQVWNDPFGLNAINELDEGQDGAGGGGASSCATLNASKECAGGYAKPSWQTGNGVPADGVRDLPDVSLFASNGPNYSAYAICAEEGDCTPDASGNFSVFLVGGTSAAAPAMAGIMALVDQKYGRQGQADYTLYPLAQQQPAAFHDITLGGNWDLCEYPPDCDLGVDNLGPYWGESTVYSATPGFDQASGWGSVDAAKLVNNWSAISFRATTTTLTVSPKQVTHGANVTLTADVAAAGSGTPTGAVAVLSSSDLPSSKGQTAISLAGGSGSTTVNYLPGGTYELTAQYGGDGVFASSTSQSETITVMPEKTILNLQGGNTVYGYPLYISAQPLGANAPTGGTDGSATGNVTFTLDGVTSTVALNVGGVASWEPNALLPGDHSVSASYPGDSSFEPASAGPVTIPVSTAYPSITVNPSASFGLSGLSGSPVYAGSSVVLGVELGPGSLPIGYAPPPGTLAPTGTVTGTFSTYLIDMNCAQPTGSFSQTGTLSSPGGMYAEYSFAQLTFSNLPVGTWYFCLLYNGDSNWKTQEYANNSGLTLVVTAPSAGLLASTTTVSLTPASIAGAQTTSFVGTVSGPAGATVAPTGLLEVFDNGNELWQYSLTPSASGAQATVTLPSVGTGAFWSNGTNQITAVYSGDANYLPSTSAAVALNAVQSGADFTLAPGQPQVNVASGSSSSAVIELASVNGFDGVVALTCTASSSQFTCGVSPASPAVNGQAQSTLSITATVPGASAARGNRPAGLPGHVYKHGFEAAGGAAIAFAALLVLPLPRRHWKLPAGLAMLMLVLLIPGCGGSVKSSRQQSNPGGTPAGTYSVVLTGTGNGIVHSVKLPVVVTAE